MTASRASHAPRLTEDPEGYTLARCACGWRDGRRWVLPGMALRSHRAHVRVVNKVTAELSLVAKRFYGRAGQ